MIPLMIGLFAQGWMLIVYLNLYQIESVQNQEILIADPPFIAFLKENYYTGFLISMFLLFPFHFCAIMSFDDVAKNNNEENYTNDSEVIVPNNKLNFFE